MVTVRLGVWCDPCLSLIVTALNEGGIETVASCCGHGQRPGNVALADGRQLFVADAEQAEMLHTFLHSLGLPDQLKDGDDR